MVPCALLCLFARYALIEYHRGRLGAPFSTLGDEVNSVQCYKKSERVDVSVDIVCGRAADEHGG